jgi:hypothetical protein
MAANCCIGLERDVIDRSSRRKACSSSHVGEVTLCPTMMMKCEALYLHLQSLQLA